MAAVASVTKTSTTSAAGTVRAPVSAARATGTRPGAAVSMEAVVPSKKANATAGSDPAVLGAPSPKSSSVWPESGPPCFLTHSQTRVSRTALPRLATARVLEISLARHDRPHPGRLLQLDVPALTEPHARRLRPAPGLRLYRSGLVPRILPIVAFVGAPLLLASDIAVFFGGYAQVSRLAALAALPIAALDVSLGPGWSSKASSRRR